MEENIYLSYILLYIIIFFINIKNHYIINEIKISNGRPNIIKPTYEVLCVFNEVKMN